MNTCLKKILILLPFLAIPLVYLYLNREAGQPLQPSLQPSLQSSVVFINETDNHAYDRSLKGSIKIAQQNSGIQNSIVLLKTRPGNKSIEEVAVDLFGKYRIGKGFNGKGILFLYVEEDKQLKIEVSYDLEGVFPDAICSRLERGARTFMLTGQQRDFLTELLVTMNLHYKKYGSEFKGELEFPIAPQTFSLSKFMSGGAGVVGRNYSDAIAARASEIVPLSAQQREQFAPAATPEESLRRYLESLDKGIGDASLPLLTDGSRVYRMENPKTPGYLRRQLEYYRAAMPYRLYTRNENAVAMFKPRNPVLHVLLRTGPDGKWYVDEARMWAEQHLFETGVDPVQKYADSALRFAWVESNHPDRDWILYNGRAKSRPLQSYAADFLRQVAELEKQIEKNPAVAENYFLLGDLIYFESYWLSAAIPLYEAGLKLKPDRADYRWRLIDVYANNSDIEQMLVQYKALSRMFPGDGKLVSAYNFYLKSYEATDREVDSFPKTSLSAGKSPLLHKIEREAKPKVPASTSYLVAQSPKSWPPQKGQVFPDFSFVDMNGAKTSLSALRGKWILLEPVGMTCPACQSFSGAHKKGPFGGIQPQSDLHSIDDYLASAGVNLRDERIQLVQLLLYDLKMQMTTLEHAERWREKFDFGKKTSHWVIAGGQDMINQHSFDMIPGYYLVDPNGMVISDSTGHNPKDNLWTDLIPKLKRGLGNVSGPANASSASRTEVDPGKKIVPYPAVIH